MDSGTGLTRITAFLEAVARRQAQHTVMAPWGFSVWNPQFAASYDHNKAVLHRVTDPAGVEQVFADAGVAHRLVVAHDETVGAACAPGFTAAGFTHTTDVIMVYAGAAPDRRLDGTSVRVDAVSTGALVEVARRRWRDLLPGAEHAVVEQLVARRGTLRDAAERVDFLAVRDAAGQVRAHADLYAGDGVAQIENVYTEPAHTGRGYARALLTEALRRAGLAAGADLVFIVADAQDWPRQWYARLGFVPAAHVHTFLRAGEYP